MRKMIFSSLFFLVLNQQVFGLLPPFYESQIELKEVLGDRRLAEKFGSGEPILTIQKNERGYLIIGNKLQIQANLKYLDRETGRMGPAKFIVEFEEPQPVGL